MEGAAAPDQGPAQDGSAVAFLKCQWLLERRRAWLRRSPGRGEGLHRLHTSLSRGCFLHPHLPEPWNLPPCPPDSLICQIRQIIPSKPLRAQGPSALTGCTWALGPSSGQLQVESILSVVTENFALWICHYLSHQHAMAPHCFSDNIRLVFSI